jgi:hypothetical protein
MIRRVTITGALFAVLYAAVFVFAYVDYRHHAGEWFADLGVVLLVLPFALAMRFLFGGPFDLTGADTLTLLAGALFCCALAWAAGFILERLALAAVRLARRRRAR